jgi:hypothetical protein
MVGSTKKEEDLIPVLKTDPILVQFLLTKTTTNS